MMSSYESDTDISYRAPKRRKLKVSSLPGIDTSTGRLLKPMQKANANQRRRKISAELVKQPSTLSLDPLLYPPGGNLRAEDEFAFDETMENLLPDFLQARLSLQEQEAECDEEVI